MRYRFGGLIFGGACTWRGLFSEFYGILLLNNCGEKFLVKYRNPLLSPPPGTYLFQSHLSGGGGAGQNRPGDIFEMGVPGLI